MKIKNQDFLYIGDMIFDLQFAQNAEVDFLHFSNNGRNMLPKNLINSIKTVDKLIDLKKILINWDFFMLKHQIVAHSCLCTASKEKNSPESLSGDLV